MRMLGCGTRLFRQKETNILTGSNSGCRGKEGIISINGGGTHAHYAHAPRVIKSQRQYAPRGHQQNGDNQKPGKKAPRNIEALIWEWEKMRREKASFWPWRYGTSRCTESKLSLADVASLLLFFREWFCIHCHYYFRVGLLRLSSVSPHSAVSVCLD